MIRTLGAPCLPSRLSCEEPPHGTVKKVDEQGVGQDALSGLPGRCFLRAHDRSHVDRAVQWFSWIGKIPMDDEGRHRRSVGARGDLVAVRDVVGVIDNQPARQGVVVLEGKPVKERDPWLAVSGSLGKERSGSGLRRVRRRDAHGLEGADEHDVLCGEKPDRLRTLTHDVLNLLARKLCEKGVIADLLDQCPADDLPAAVIQDLRDGAFGGNPSPTVTVVPQLDLHPNGTTVGLADHGDRFAPVVEKAGLSHAVLRSPTTQVHQLGEDVLELVETVLESGLRILLPSLEETEHLVDRLGVRHHQVERVRNRFVSAARLAVRYVEVVVRFGVVAGHLGKELKAFDLVDSFVKVLNGAGEVEYDDEGWVRLGRGADSACHALGAEGIDKLRKLRVQAFALPLTSWSRRRRDPTWRWLGAVVYARRVERQERPHLIGHDRTEPCQCSRRSFAIRRVSAPGASRIVRRRTSMANSSSSA